MTRIQVTWVVKIPTGQVKGPYSTEAILRMISDGVFTGQELISKIPDGKWSSISKEPEFYDRLLEALEGIVDSDSDKYRKMEAETIIMPPPKENTLVIAAAAAAAAANPAILVEASKRVIDILESRPEVAAAQGVPLNVMGRGIQKTSSIVNLKSLPPLMTDGFDLGEFLKRVAGPLLIFAGVIVLAFYLFSSDGTDASGKISLIAPGKGSALLSDVQVKEKLNAAVISIEQDTFESYLYAENQLVGIVEGAPSNLEVRALLCVVYKELWPFAKQDAADIKVIALVTQTTKAINVVSPYGSICEITKLLTAGRYKEARGVVESTLESADHFSLLAVLYEAKAELLAGDKDIQNAIPYYEKAIQLWEHWLRPQAALGALMAENNQATDGANYLRRVLERNPHHKVARINLGLIEFQSFKKNDNAYNLLISAAESKSRASHALESKGLQGLAEILLERGEKKRALEFAQKGYVLNPNNMAVRQIVVRLGGSDKLKSEKSQDNELMFMGDQYVRQGDCLAAQAEFKAAFEIDRKNGTAAMKAAKCLWQLNQSFEAIEWLKKAIKAESKLVSAYVLQADYMTQRYDFIGAIRVLTAATKIAPNNYEVLRGLGLLELRKNNMPATINYLMRSLKAYDGDVDTYILLAKANSILASGINPIRSSEAEKKEAAQKDSIRFATKAVELDATNVEAQVTYAKMLAQINGVDFGINYVKELIKKFSFSTEYRIALAEIYKSEDRFTQAKDIYEQVVDADQRNKKAWVGLGESYRALGLIDKSLRAFLTAAVIDPSDGEALFQAGKVYLESNRFDEAIKQFRRVQILNPNFPRTHYYIGRTAFASGDFAVAIDSAKAEKKQNPNLADSYLLAAETFSARRQYSECATEYSLAMRLRPQGADIYVKAAQCYRQSGSVDVAEDMLALASARESGYADIYKEQGAIYEVKGDAASAVQSYNKYLALSPNAPDRMEISQKIMRLGGR